MVKHSQKSAENHSVDRLMQKLALSLIRDFQNDLMDPTFCSTYREVIKSGKMVDIRGLVPAMKGDETAPVYKRAYQIQSLFKRYRFQQDIYSDQQLIEMAIKSFNETQDRVAKLDLDKLSDESQLILDLAAAYVADVLGPYDETEHRSLCRFGSGASVGIPARLACEAARWELPISGSLEQISWFDSEMSQIDCIQEYWVSQLDSDPKRSVYQETSSLKLTLVPKTFKSLRAIMPNTTIGSYMSYGLGEIMRKRLKRKGYDIRSLQMRHRYLAESASRNNLAVTADLSSASDSISVALVERLFPPDWFDVLNRSRIGTVVLPDGTHVESFTFCTMGIGYTFPLQTLVFLSLLKAIEYVNYGRLDRRTISVYGDDMIYSCRMHEHVVRFFTEFGFVINIDKTYHEGGFRESCGGDYYRGVDVRPFQPRNGSAVVGSKAYEAILYKCINGLLMRWSEYEIVGTLAFLTSEVEDLVGKCKLVPGDFPDDAGIKCPSLTHWNFLMRTEVAKPKSIGHGLFRFSYLRFQSDDREEVRHVPYLWSSLSGRRSPVIDYAGGFDRRGSPYPLVKLIHCLLGLTDVPSPLIEKEVKPVCLTRSKLTGRRLRRKSTFVTVSHTGRYTRQSGISGFESRR